MRIAVVAVAVGGAHLACEIGRILPVSADIFCRREHFLPQNATDCGRQIIFVEDWQTTTARIFVAYDALLFIGATGIAVRFVAPFVKSKLADPAVLTMDESGKFVISLLSGHVGGANKLTEKLAAKLNAIPVITTATDTKGQLAPDKIAGELFLRPFPKEHIKIFNRATLDGEPLAWFVANSAKDSEFFCAALKNYGIEATITNAKNFAALSVVITDEPLPAAKNVLQLVPRRFVAGVGCRRGASEEQITAALKSAADSQNRPLSFVKKIASIDLKSDEAGLWATAKKLGAQTEFFCAEELNEKTMEMFLPRSSFVNKVTRADNVADAAAVCGGGKNFALMKSEFQKMTEGKNFPFDKKVTVSLMWEN